MNKNNTKLIIGVGVALLVITFFVILLFFRQQSGVTTDATKSTLPQNQELKKVENSVSVSVQQGADGRRVNFSVTNIPDKYTTIEYEFSYMNGSGRLQGGNSSPT